MIVLAGAVVALFVMMSRATSGAPQPAKAVRDIEAAGAKAGPWYGIDTDNAGLLGLGLSAPTVMPDTMVPVNDGAVKPKTAGAAGSRFWGAAGDDLTAYEAPISEDPDSAFSYSKFQQALLSGADRQVEHQSSLKISNVKDLEAWNEQLAPLRDMLSRSGKTIEQFVEEQNVSLPEDIVERWYAVQHLKPVEVGPIGGGAFGTFGTYGSSVSVEEAASLMKDAIQSVPSTNVDFASSIMREILHARTEASALGIQVPPLSPEQQRTIEYWRVSAQQPAADLAAKLLSR